MVACVLPVCDTFPVYLLFPIIFSVQSRSYDATVGQSLAGNAYEQGDDEGSTHTFSLPNSAGVTIKDKDDVEEIEEEAHDSVGFPTRAFIHTNFICCFAFYVLELLNIPSTCRLTVHCVFSFFLRCT